MKYIPRSKKFFLCQAVLASTFFGGFPLAANAALTALALSTDTTTTPDGGGGAGGLGGYDITAASVTLTVTDGYIIGRTPNAAGGTSVDNDSANPGLGQTSSALTFLGDGTTQGRIGPTNPLGLVNITGGAGTTVIFQDDVFVTGGVNFKGAATTTTNLQLADGVDITGNVDNLGVSNVGRLIIQGSSLFSDSIGATKGLNLISISGNTKTVSVAGLVNANDIQITSSVDTVSIGGATTLNNDLAITGASNIVSLSGTLGAKNVNINTGNSNTLTVNDNATLTGDLNVASNLNTVLLNKALQVDDIALSGDNNAVTVTGTTKATGITLTGNTNVLNLLGNVTAPNTNFTAENTINYGDNVTNTGAIDNKSGAGGVGTINFLGAGTVTGTVGLTDRLKLVSLNGIAGSNVNFNSAVSTNTLAINDSNAVFTGIVTAPAITIDTGSGTFNANTVGDVNFTDSGSVILGDNTTLTGKITTANNGDGDLVFKGNGTVTGTVGGVGKLLNQVSIESGAGKIINLQDDVFVNNGINFSAGSTPTTILRLSDNVDVTGSIDNKNVTPAGILQFLGSSTVSGSIGATKSLSNIDVQGTSETVSVTGTTSADTIIVTGATNTVSFGNKVTANMGITFQGAGNTINFANDVTAPFTNFAAENTANYADGADVTGLIDNTSGTAGKGILNFAGDGSVSGTVGATKSMNTINLNGAAGKVVSFANNVTSNTINVGAGTGNFDGNVTGNINITNNGFVVLADNKIITGPVDNTSGVADKGTLTLEGSGTVTGSIGNSNSLLLANLNSLAGASETIELNGAVVKAATIQVNDNAATATTLKLNNAAMTLTTTNGILPLTNNVDILDIYSAATINGNIGNSVGPVAFNLVKVGEIGNTTVNAPAGGIFATTTQFNGSGTLTLTDNTNITGNVTTTVDNQGILALQGSTNITGTIGAPGLALNAINLLGLNEILSIGNDTYANNINIANDGTVIIQDNADFTGNINNSSGVDDKGTLEFAGSGSVAGNIGASNTLKIINVNTGADNETVELKGNVVRATEINVQDNGGTKATTLLLNNAAMVLTTTDGITSETANKNTLDIKSAALINSDIGGVGNEFLLVKVGEVGNTIINGDIFATTTQFQANNKLSLTDGSDVTGNIDSLNPNEGILELRGDHTITGTVGAVNDLSAINVIGAGKTVNFKQDVSANNVNFAGLANNATVIDLDDGVDITGNVDNTTGANNVGILNFAGDGSVSGTIGATNSLFQINLEGAAGKIVQFGGNTTVGTGNINFLQDSQLNIANNANITGNIDTDAANQGTVNFTGNGVSTVNGLLGVNNTLKAVQLSGAGGTINFNQNINANSLKFNAANTTANLASGITVTGPITTSAAGQGDLIFKGNFDVVNNPIGSGGLPLNKIVANGVSGTVVNVYEDLFATNINVDNGGLLFAKDVVTMNGTVNLSNASALAVANNAVPLTITGDLNVPAGTTLQFDLNTLITPTPYIDVTGNANINANSNLSLKNTPQAYAAGNYDILLVDSNGGVNEPLSVTSDSLLLFFDVEQVANKQLFLHIDVIPASTYANRINTIPVAGALDAMAGLNFLGSLQELLDQLPYFTTVEQLNDALAALAPIVDNSFTQETFAAQLLGYGAVSDRLRHVRQRKLIPGATGEFASGIASGDDWDENGHGRWVKIYGQYSDQNEREQVAGYNAETWGVALGSDVSLNDLSLIGVSANLSHTFLSHDVSPTKTSMYSLQAALYGEQDFCEWFYFNWVGSVAYNKYTAERNFVFGLLPLSPKADFNGWQFGAKGELGYEYLYQGYHIIPNASLYYSWLRLGGYNESGAGTASQSVESQSYSMLKGGVGVRAAYNCPYDMGDRRSIIFQPELRFNIFRDFINDNMQTTSQFTGGGPSFVTVGPTPSAMSYNVGASLSVFSDYNNYVVTLSYDLENKSDYQANAGFLRLRYEW